ncbi:hypothetical protein Scep_016476 [Stephania cephalantha]|uniref:Uncharacterized protein n=1 Tax=Stephania cephalantha TaxID=152367 RepID=A0AAP0INY2_9MAGN
MKTKFNQNFKIEFQENANQDCDSKVLTPSREAIHESQVIPETRSRRSRGRPAAAEEPGPSSSGGGAGPKQRRRRIAEATRRRGGGGRSGSDSMAAADDRGGDQDGGTRGRGVGSRGREPVDGRRRIRGAKEWRRREDARSGSGAPRENTSRAARAPPTLSIGQGESRSTGLPMNDRDGESRSTSTMTMARRRRRRWCGGSSGDGGGGDLWRRRL